MLAFRSVQQGNHCAREEFLYELKATIVLVRSFSTNSSGTLRAAAARPSSAAEPQDGERARIAKIQAA
jgi:hypothetical protein